MSTVPNARKKDVWKNTKRLIEERGQVPNGSSPEMPSSPLTPFAAHAKIRARCHITPRHWITDADLSMDDLSITIYPVQNPFVTDAIVVSIAIDSDALSVARLERNERVRDAIRALMQTIKNELFSGESTGNDSKTKQTQHLERNLKLYAHKEEEIGYG